MAYMTISYREYFIGVYLISVTVHFYNIIEIKLLWQDLEFEGEGNIVYHLNCVRINDHKLSDISCSDS